MKRKPRKVALGPPLDVTEEELDLLALVTPEDIEDAKAIGRQRMTARGAALLETEKAARPEDDPLSLGA